MKILNIYGQYMNHMEARIVGNREGLEALKKVIEIALIEGRATTEGGGSHVNPDGDVIGSPDPLFASDGEGYEVQVEMHNDAWGIDPATGKEDLKSFWNIDESNPQYLMWEIMKAKDEELEPIDALDGWYYDWLKFEKVKNG